MKYEIINKMSKEYPRQLYDLSNPPDELYVMGNKKIMNDFGIAIVGARKCSKESEKIASEISEELSFCGINVISGLAVGIDKIAHENCLKVKGKTIAILGGGFENLYPKENIKLVDKILENEGLIITEYAPKTPCFKYNFVSRNRIIAALSKGIVIIEAKKNSGSITTAQYGIKLKRDIFVCPRKCI